MPAIELDQLPQDMVERLRRLAQQHGLDPQAEAVKCLEKGLSEREQVELELSEIRALREQSPQAWLTDEMLRAARDEGRL